VGIEKKEIYVKGDLVIIDDDKNFREIAVILSSTIPMYHRLYEFYQVFSIIEGCVYIVPCEMVKGRIKG
jgi:hypothetical protein